MSNVLCGKSNAQKRLALAISESIENVNQDKLNSIVAFLQQKSECAPISIIAIEECIFRGISRLILEGSQEDLEKLKELFESGQLIRVENIPIEYVKFLDTEITPDYVLYVHYSYKAKDDFDKCLKNSDDLAILTKLDWDTFKKPNYDPKFAGLDLQLDGVKKIEGFMSRLKDLLKNGENKKNGVVVLFYDAGLRQLLEEIRPVLFFKDDAQKEEILNSIKKELFEKQTELPPLKFGSVVGRILTKLAEKEDLGHNLRILTALDLVDVFSEMSDVHDLRDLFLGEPGNIGYDSPKIIDAIIRLRLLGSGIPIFRLDQDILFPNEDKDKAYEMLKKAIAGQIKAIERHQVKSTIHSTILSVNYEKPKKAVERCGTSNLIAYSRGYATRIQPALLVKTDLVKKVNTSVDGYNWDKYAEDSFKKDLVKQFFDKNNLIKWGAPTTAVISGALMYLSDGVVLNLPPFSNFSLNVMWIDDHLRYAVHRELGDFAAITLEKGGSLLHTRSNKNSVIKCRSGFNNLAFYTLGTYLPALLWGSIFDAWISTEPLVKLRKTDASELKKELEWIIKKAQDTRGILAKRIKHAQAGHPIVDEVQLREDLRQEALKRIRIVREVWGELYLSQTDQTDQVETFASCWSKRELPTELQDLINKQEDEIKKELARGIPQEIMIGTVWGNQLERLITDAVNYLRWVQKWPHVVQVVRSLKRGILPSDL